MSDWLSNLDVGDEVELRSGFRGNTTTATVERVTATQIIVNGARFDRKSGRLRGGVRRNSWNTLRLCVPDSWHRKKYLTSIDWLYLNLSELKTDELHRIAQTIDAVKQRKDA